MKFSDIVALAKSGYTVSDIKELISMTDSVEADSATIEKADSETAPAAESEKEDTTTSADSSEDNTDYKKLYEDTLSKLEKAQASNNATNVGMNIKNNDEILTSLFEDFF